MTWEHNDAVFFCIYICANDVEPSSHKGLQSRYKTILEYYSSVIEGHMLARFSVAAKTKKLVPIGVCDSEDFWLFVAVMWRRV